MVLNSGSLFTVFLIYFYVLIFWDFLMFYHMWNAIQKISFLNNNNNNNNNNNDYNKARGLR